jgi:hypothetical protein
MNINFFVTDKFSIAETEYIDNSMGIYFKSLSKEFEVCKNTSNKCHSRYTRTIKDCYILGKSVTIQ